MKKVNLERLFETSLRIKILVHFLGAPKRPYSFPELKTRMRSSKRKLEKELANLARLGIVSFSRQKKVGYFQLNMKCPIYEELKALIFKVEKTPREKIFDPIRKTRQVKYAILTGFFTQAREVPTDILLIGRVNPKKFQLFIKRLERQMGREINYTIMTPNEFSYREASGDQFLSQIKSKEHIVLIDTYRRAKKRKVKK